MKKFLILSLCVIFLNAQNVSDILGKAAFNSYINEFREDGLSDDDIHAKIIQIAKDVKSGKIKNKYIKENTKSNDILLDDSLFINNCFDQVPISDHKGKPYSINICIASKSKFNKYVLADIIIGLLSKSSLAELLTFGGKEVLKDEITDSLNTENEIYITKMQINKIILTIKE